MTARHERASARQAREESRPAWQELRHCTTAAEPGEAWPDLASECGTKARLNGDGDSPDGEGEVWVLIA